MWHLIGGGREVREVVVDSISVGGRNRKVVMGGISMEEVVIEVVGDGILVKQVMIKKNRSERILMEMKNFRDRLLCKW